MSSVCLPITGNFFNCFEISWSVVDFLVIVSIVQWIVINSFEVVLMFDVAIYD